MSKDIKEFRLGELFCGPGGLALGAMRASISDPDYRIIHVWANDYDRSTCDTYTRNICPDNPGSVKCGDVRKLDKDVGKNHTISVLRNRVCYQRHFLVHCFTYRKWRLIDII